MDDHCLLVVFIIGFIHYHMTEAFIFNHVDPNKHAIPRVSLCHSCDDSQPGKECATHFTDKICTHDQPFCLTTITGGMSKMTITKGCASDNECHDLWWHKTKPNPACSQSNVENGLVPAGTKCNYCCSAAAVNRVHCNANIFPQHLTQYPDVVGTLTTHSPPLMSKTTSTPVPKTSKKTTPSTMQTTPVQMSTEETTKSSPPTTHHSGHGHLTTNHHHEPLATVCLNCVDDTSTGQKCDENNQFTVCGRTHPYCMTSFYGRHNNYRIVRQCATYNTCAKNWAKTDSRQCLRGDILTGNRSFPSECHYCCKTHDPTKAFCNRHSEMLLPLDLIIFHTGNTTQPSGPVCEVSDDSSGLYHSKVCLYTSPYCLNTVITDRNGKTNVRKRCVSEPECYSEWWVFTRGNSDCKSASPSNVGAHGLTCHYCCQSNSSGVACNSDILPPNKMFYGNTKPAGHTISASTTTRHTTDNRTTAGHTTSASTTTRHTTDNRTTAGHTTSATTTTRHTTDNRTTAGHTTSASITTRHTTDNRTAAGHTTSASITTRHTTDNRTTAGHTTDASTATQPSTGVPTTPTKSIVGSRCQVCVEDRFVGTKCNITDVQTCPSHEPYCMNILVVSPSGFNRTLKRCGADSECYNDWWVKTRNTPQCLADPSSINPGKHGITCRYCCSTSTGVCNYDVRPPSLQQYSSQPLTTGDTTTTGSVTTYHASSTKVTATTSSTLAVTTLTTHPPTSAPTTAATTTVMTTIKPTPKVVPNCFVCQNGCPFIQEEKPCSDGFCMTTVTDDVQYTRTIQKRCVSRTECVAKWWLQTSDTDFCLQMMNLGNVPSGVTIECSYCCVGSGCNRPLFPNEKSLFDGSGSS